MLRASVQLLQLLPFRPEISPPFTCAPNDRSAWKYEKRIPKHSENDQPTISPKTSKVGGKSRQIRRFLAFPDTTLSPPTHPPGGPSFAGTVSGAVQFDTPDPSEAKRMTQLPFAKRSDPSRSASSASRGAIRMSTCGPHQLVAVCVNTRFATSKVVPVTTPLGARKRLRFSAGS